jgi:LPS sulfotransferase NodH
LAWIFRDTLTESPGRYNSRTVITIVSGLPRSGTSLMMQMLEAGGMPILTDFQREPDIDNPRGYFEWEPAKLLPKAPQRIDEAEGKAVKVVSQLLFSLPEGRDYKVIFMERPLPEVLASQDKMLARRGTNVSDDPITLGNAFQEHMREVVAWLEERPQIPVHRVGYRKLLRDPAGTAASICAFLALDLDAESMALQVDPGLYRNRG